MELIRQPKIENVRMMDRLMMATQSRSSSSGVVGTLYLTATHLIFVDHEGRNETWVLHSHLASIEKSSVTSIGTPLHIKCKNFQSITFILPKEKDAHEVWTSLFNLSQPLTYEDLYCFRYSASNEPFKEQRSRGWSKFDLQSEYRRQGVPNKYWVVSDLNRSYELCDSYPRVLFVPATATESMLKASASFRSKGRLPILSYVSPNGAVICRCSQPLSGFNSRCEEDEALLDCILRTKDASRVLYVVDTRPRVSGLITSFILSLQSLPPYAKSLYLWSNDATAAAESPISTATNNSTTRSHTSSRKSSPSPTLFGGGEDFVVATTACPLLPSVVSRRPSVTTTTSDLLPSTHTRKSMSTVNASKSRRNSNRTSNNQTSGGSVGGRSSSGRRRTSSRRRRHRSVDPSSTPIISTSCDASSTATSSSNYSSLLSSAKLMTYSLLKMNAYANKAAGKGYENENFYENIKFNFFGIENIHVMRGSLSKLVEASEMFNMSSDAFISALESSGWLKHIKAVLEAAAFVVKAVQEGISVVVHCSDGWDRTAQTCSIAALLLDPYYRTLNGFQALIEKEWLSFGHKFTERCGHIQTGDTKETAPVFTQFVDCIWQIIQQFPSEFEFNEKFLLLLHDHVYSCQFGNFIGNTDKERQDLKVKERTYSLWAYLDARRDLLTNPLYYVKRRSVLGGSEDLQEQILNLDTSPQTIQYWRGFYNRFESGIHPKESISDLMVVTYNHILSLERHMQYLERRLKEKETLQNRKNQQNQNQHPVATKEDHKKKEDFLLVDSRSGTKKLSDSSKGSSSFDSIDYPLKVVKQCMERLEIKQREEMEFAMTSSVIERTTLAATDSHPLDGATPQPPSRPDRDKLRLDDLRIVYPEGLRGGPDNIMTRSTLANMPASDVRQRLPSLEDLDEEQLKKEMESVAVEWESLRYVTECQCGFPFDQTTPRSHCYSCGKLHCVRCIDRKLVLPGHVTTSAGNDDTSSASSDVFESPTAEDAETVSVCRNCYKIILQKDSVSSPT